MDLTGLTKGERFIVDWQYRMAGDFKTSLAHAIMLADETNLTKLASGFPDEVGAFLHYSREENWWPNLQKKIGIKREEE